MQMTNIYILYILIYTLIHVAFVHNPFFRWDVCSEHALIEIFQIQPLQSLMGRQEPNVFSVARLWFLGIIGIKECQRIVEPPLKHTHGKTSTTSTCCHPKQIGTRSLKFRNVDKHTPSLIFSWKPTVIPSSTPISCWVNAFRIWRSVA